MSPFRFNEPSRVPVSGPISKREYWKAKFLYWLERSILYLQKYSDVFFGFLLGLILLAGVCWLCILSGTILYLFGLIELSFLRLPGMTLVGIFVFCSILERIEYQIRFFQKEKD